MNIKIIQLLLLATIFINFFNQTSAMQKRQRCSACSSGKYTATRTTLQRIKTTENCIVCYDNKANITLGCKHSFCVTCLVRIRAQAFAQKAERTPCPLCRIDIFTCKRSIQLRRRLECHESFNEICINEIRTLIRERRNQQEAYAQAAREIAERENDIMQTLIAANTTINRLEDTQRKINETKTMLTTITDNIENHTNKSAKIRISFDLLAFIWTKNNEMMEIINFYTDSLENEEYPEEKLVELKVAINHGNKFVRLTTTSIEKIKQLAIMPQEVESLFKRPKATTASHHQLI